MTTAEAVPHNRSIIDPLPVSARPGWAMAHASDDYVIEHTTTHKRWPGTFSVRRCVRGRGLDQRLVFEFFITVGKADSLHFHRSVSTQWLDGRLVVIPSSHFRNGRPRPIRKDAPRLPEHLANAEHLCRAMGWLP